MAGWHKGAIPPGYAVWWGDVLRQGSDASRLQYRRNRYYDPQTGRFTQQDPIGLAGGLNLYGFAAGDPVNFSDPFGLAQCSRHSECPSDVLRAYNRAIDFLGSAPGRAVTALAEGVGLFGRVLGHIPGVRGATEAITGIGFDGQALGRDQQVSALLGAGAELIPVPGIGPGWTKLRGNQGWRDASGRIWRKDRLHRDHWDVSNSRGRRIAEVDFEGRQIWPEGPKNKNRR